MPRYVANESEDESEPKTGRRTRASLAAASATTDSPIRRSTRNRHGSANPDGSSPESITEALVPTAQVTSRVTRRRAAAAAVNTADLLTVPENHRTLRSRKNSVSSNISDNVDIDSAPGTPRQRTLKRLSLIEPSPSTPKPAVKTRRSIRASSETKTPPPPVRTTRRTRATSIEPEPLVDRINSTTTPSKRKRQQASSQPTEPVVTEEANESDDDIIIEIPEVESEDENSPEKTLSQSSRRSSSSSVKKSSKKNDSLKESTDTEVNVDESLAEKSSEQSMEALILPAKDKSVDEKAAIESETEKSSPIRVQVGNISAKNNTKKEDSPKEMKALVVKARRISLDKSKELGMRIEDLLNESTEEQEKSPGNKENEKLNISPKKIKKNLEFTVSNVNVVRGKSLGSTKFMNKPVLEGKINTSLDEQVLSRSQYDFATTKSNDTEIKNSEDSTLEKNSVPESPGAVQSSTKNYTESRGKENESKHSSMESNYTKVDETIVENEIIEEFTLYDSNDEDSKSDFSLTMEDDTNEEEKRTENKQNEKEENFDLKEVLERNGNGLEILKPLKSNNSPRKSIVERNSKEAKGEEETKKQSSTPKKGVSLGSEEAEKNGENRETEAKEKTSEDRETNNLETEDNLNKNIDEEKPMDINDDHQKVESIENSFPGKASPKKQSVNKNKSLKNKNNESSSNIGNSKSDDEPQEPDSDCNIAIDDLFQNISAEEWNKKHKNQSPEKESTKRRKSGVKNGEETLCPVPAAESEDLIDLEDDLFCVKDKSWKDNETKDSDAEASASDDRVILKKNYSSEKVNPKRKSSIRAIIEDAEIENEESTRSVKGKKSPEKSNKFSIENEIEKKENNKRKSISQSQEEGMEVDHTLSDAETIPTTIDNPMKPKENNLGTEYIGEEKQPGSTGNTPKEKKNKTPVKSATKLKKSVDIYEFEDSFDVEKDHEVSEDNSNEDEPQISVNGKGKKFENKNKNHHVMSRTPKTPLNKNISILAVVDSDSGRENVDDLDEESSDNNEEIMPRFLFDPKSNDDNDDSDMEDEDKSANTMDSDIAREMNLAGDDDVEHSDDDVPGDECRASESEHSDENDEGSDIDDFIVADDDVETSEYSEEDSKPKLKFKRILAQSLSEEDEDNDETDEELGTEKHTDDKQRRKSICKPPTVISDEELAEKSTELEKKKLNFSFESDKSFSNKKLKKGKIVANLGESEDPISPSLEKNLDKSTQKLKNSSKPIRSLLNSTIDLCTPESNAITPSGNENQTPDANISVTKKKKSAQKLKKNLVEDLSTSTPYGMNKVNAIEGEEGEAVVAMLTPKTKTPNKEKKTPKSLKKNQRDSIQLIAEAALSKPQKSDLNKTMATPNSESPVTKFLKKERLNESLPLIELKKRRSKSFGMNALSNMEEEQEANDNTEEKDEGKEIGDDFDTHESDGDDNIEANVNQINGNSQGNEDEDEDEDETDEGSDGVEKNEASDDIIDENEEEEDEESSDEEIVVKEKQKSINQEIEEPETRKIGKSRKSKDRKSLTMVLEGENTITSSKKQLTKKRKSIGKKIRDDSDTDESDGDDNTEENVNEINGNSQGNEDEDKDGTDEESDEAGEIEASDAEIDENEEEDKESSDEEIIVKKKQKSANNKVEPATKKIEKSRKSKDRKSLTAVLEDEDIITPSKKDLTKKRKSIGSTPSGEVNEKAEGSTDGEKAVFNEKCQLSNVRVELPNKKKRARLESSETPQSLKISKKLKIRTKFDETLNHESDSDEAPESLGFAEARKEALEEMKGVAASLKATKEAKKKKRRDQLERIRKEKEAKAASKNQIPTAKIKAEPSVVGKNNLKRLPEELLENLSDLPERPKKKRKLSNRKEEEKIVPSKYMFSPGKSPRNSLKVEDYDPSVSTGGGTTHFSVINLEKAKKQPKKAVAVASFRERMLARNPRQPISAFLMYQAKQKASGKQLSSRK